MNYLISRMKHNEVTVTFSLPVLCFFSISVYLASGLIPHTHKPSSTKKKKNPQHNLSSRFHLLLPQNKTCNEAVTKFEETAKRKRAAMIKTAMGEE